MLAPRLLAPLALSLASLLCTPCGARAQDDDSTAVEEALGALGAGRERGALKRLRALPDGVTLPIARRLLEESSDPEVLIGAAEWVAEKTPPPPPGSAATPANDRAAPVRRRLAAARDPAPRAALLEALGALSGVTDLGTLDDLVRNAVQNVDAAARGLCRSRQPDALRVVFYALRDLGDQVVAAREESAESLDEGDGEDEQQPEEQATSEAAPPAPSAEVRRRALLDALRWMVTTERGLRLVEAVRLEPSPELLQVLHAVRLREHRQGARALAIELVGHDDPALRAAAVQLLAACRAREADDDQLVLAALDDPAPEVRSAAAEAVWPLQLEAAIPRLIELLDDDAVRPAAHETLKKLARQPLPARRSMWEAWLSRRQGEVEAGSPE